MKKGLCYRCEYRAQFLETEHGPRSECGNTGSAVGSCYMVAPVKPLVLLKNANSFNRPQSAGAASRSHSETLADCRLNLESQRKGSVLYWTPKSLDDHHLKARETLWFMDCHPALGSPIFDLFSLLNIQISQVCKRGMIEPIKGNVEVYWNRENYKKFKEKFDQEFKRCDADELKRKPLISIDVPYKILYGEAWAPDHIEYWGDLSFVAFTGTKFNAEADFSKWQRLSGIEASGRSFEDLIVKSGEKFKKIFGNFSKDDFHTAREIKNNKNLRLFIFKEETKTGSRVMIRNPKYLRVSSAELNRRWWKWFSKTAYCKKNWSETAKLILAGKTNCF